MSKKVGLFLCPKGGGYANGIQNATLAKIDEAGEKLQNIGSSVENVGKKFLPVTAAASSNANTNVSMMDETFKYCAPIASALGFSAENDYVADHQLNMFEDFIGYQGSAVLDESVREEDTVPKLPMTQKNELPENTALPHLPEQPVNMQQSSYELDERGMPT